MSKIASKFITLSARVWALPRAKKLLITGVVGALALVGIGIEPGNVEAIMNIVMIASEVLQ